MHVCIGLDKTHRADFFPTLSRYDEHTQICQRCRQIASYTSLRPPDIAISTISISSSHGTLCHSKTCVMRTDVIVLVTSSTTSSSLSSIIILCPCQLLFHQHHRHDRDHGHRYQPHRHHYECRYRHERDEHNYHFHYHYHHQYHRHYNIRVARGELSRIPPQIHVSISLLLLSSKIFCGAPGFPAGLLRGSPMGASWEFSAWAWGPTRSSKLTRRRFGEL